jgi:hypothetical protein
VRGSPNLGSQPDDSALATDHDLLIAGSAV